VVDPVFPGLRVRLLPVAPHIQLPVTAIKQRPAPGSEAVWLRILRAFSACTSARLAVERI
jgi:hypothetical protein